MKILYGVQGTGNGHITRARMMAAAFAKLDNSNIEIQFLFSGRPKQEFFDMECFGNCLYRQGLTFVTEKGKVNYFKSAFYNNPIRFFSEIYNLDIEQYDLIITDFEPITAWAGKIKGIQVIGLGHQYAFGHNIPLAGYSLLASFIMRYFAPSSISLGLHWHHFGHNILPPIIDNKLARTNCNESIVVYLPFEDQKAVCALLNSLDNYHFIQYSPELCDNEKNNVSQRKTCHDGFKRDLAASRAVICNAGFELVSECLQMGIPTLVKAVNGQFEQQSNAAALVELGYGDSIYSLDREPISKWLKSNKQPPKVHFNNTADVVADWLTHTQTKEYHLSAENLCMQLWNTSCSSHPTPA
jgi:uncharacterized protein (TIGR00661 family)